MRAFRTCRSVLPSLVAAALAAGSPGARADELLVMPYACHVVGGRPVLTPAEDQGHPVIGRREQQEFRACSPVNPRLCRRWNVHRFDLDCGGTRVPWVEVAAAAYALRDGGAFVSGGGRFALEMPPRWSLPPDAPCARSEAGGWGFGRRFCAERLARVRRVTVEMPTGFAPMLGIDGIFVKDPAPRGAVADATPRREPVPGSSANPQRAKPVPEPVRKEPAKEPAPPPAKSSPPPAQEPAKTELSAAGSGAAGVAPVIPKIINGANAPQTPGSDSAPGIATGALPEPSKAARAETPPQSEVAGSGASVPDRVAAAGGDAAEPLPPPSVSAGPLPMDAAAITAVSLAMLTLLTLGLVLRRGRPATSSVLSRDISAVSLGKADARPTAGALTLVAEPATGRALDLSPTLPSGPPATWGDAMPRTREDALRVLGMGIAPDVNAAAVKKIIDGLRLSWHPDHARDAADRAMRELRLKQINAAWDIIAGQGAG